MCLAPFCKVILHTTFRNQQCITDGKPSICKVVFICWDCWDMEVCHASIVEHCWVCCWSIPPTKYIIKNHIKPTNGQAVLCDITFPITSCPMHFCRSTTVYVSSIHGTKGILEKWVEFWIIWNYGWCGYADRGKVNILSVEWWRWEKYEHFHKVSVGYMLFWSWPVTMNTSWNCYRLLLLRCPL